MLTRFGFQFALYSSTLRKLMLLLRMQLQLFYAAVLLSGTKIPPGLTTAAHSVEKGYAGIAQGIRQ